MPPCNYCGKPVTITKAGYYCKRCQKLLRSRRSVRSDSEWNLTAADRKLLKTLKVKWD